MSTAEEMRAYVMREVQRLTGPQLPVERDTEIFEGFVRRFGKRDAWRVARASVEVHKGLWRGAPVTPLRFTEGHDDFFVRPVLALLSEGVTKGEGETQ